MKRKILVFLLALCLAAALVPVTAFAGGGPSFGGGTGTKEDPWLITSRENLIALAEFLNSGDAATNYNNCDGYYFKQTADIDLTGVKWEPIGYSSGTCFSGNYDGDGHIIANAYSEGKADIDTKGNYSSTAGIFGWVLFGSVQNLHVKAATFEATGKNDYSFVGGITGVCYGASIENCSVTNSTLESKRNNNNNCAGSIAGYSAGGQFENCAAENNHVTSMAYGGGFVGEVDDDNAGITTPSAFINCYAAKCKVTATTGDPRGSSFAGGFAGQITNEKPTAENCFVYRATLSTDGTSASHQSIGVFAGNLWGNSTAHYQSKIVTKNCYYGECGTQDNAEGAAKKTAEEFENGTVAKLLGNAFVQHGGSPSLSSKPADYSAVDAAIAKANALNKDDYKDFTAVEDAINAVVRGNPLSEQVKVDAMAKAIEDAIAALQYKGADYSKVDAAIAKANALNKDEYKDFSAVEAAVNAVVRGKPLTEQTAVDAMAQAIENAIAALQSKGADYSAVDAAIAKADKLNRDEYKDFSAVEAAVSAVVRGKPLTEQTEVDAMAKAIEDALAALQFKGADYSKVDAAIAKANALNRDEYKDFSAVEAAVRAVVRGKPLSEQAEVDAMAKAIEDAIAALEKKPVEMTVQLPQTGDDSNLALWMALLLVSGAAICTMMAGKKKNYGK